MKLVIASSPSTLQSLVVIVRIGAPAADGVVPVSARRALLATPASSHTIEWRQVNRISIQLP
jgi:hypothetical protein